MENSNGYFPSKDVWNAQNKSSFVKVYPDWFFNPYGKRVDWNNAQTLYSSRFKLDFVQHEGQEGSYKTKCNITVGLPVVKAGSNGTNEGTGISALMLANLILSGELAAKAAEARTINPNGKELFACIGGTPSKRSPTGQPVFRKFSIWPSAKEGNYMLCAEQCQGVEGRIGGIMPASGAPRERISVLVSENYMQTLGEYIITEWTAYKSSIYTYKLMLDCNMRENGGQGQPTAPQMRTEPASYSQQVAPVQTPVQQPSVPVNNKIWVFADNSRFGIMGAADTPEKAVVLARQCFKKLKECEYKYICDDKSIAARLKEEILDPNHEFGYLTPVQMTSSVGLKSENTGSTHNLLNVLVCPNGGVVAGG